MSSASPLRARWLGRVPYREAEALQRAIHERTDADYLLLQEHPHVYTLGSRADPSHVLRDPASVGADLVVADRGGDVTYHGPGQLVGYPVDLAGRVARGPARCRRVRAQARGSARRRCSPTSGSRPPRYRSTRACGSATRRSRRSACGWRGAGPATASRSTSIPISRCSTTSCRAGSPTVESPQWRGCSATHPACGRSSTASSRGSPRRSARSLSIGKTLPGAFAADDLAPFTAARPRERPVRLLGRLAAAGVESEVDPAARRPEWMKVRARFDDEYLELKRLVREPRSPHGVRGGRVPEHLRMLGRSHRHVHDSRRPVHPGVRVLPGRHAQAARGRRRRAAARRRRGVRARPRARRDHVRRPRRSPRRRRVRSSRPPSTRCAP